MHLFLGPNVCAFEREFGNYCEAAEAIGVGSGTVALYLSLRTCDVGPGDEVITVANTFIATVEAITMTGALPIFVDVDLVTATIDPEQVVPAITSRTRALLPVHRDGQAFACPQGSLPVTERLATRTLSLSMFPELTLSEITTVCDGIRAHLPFRAYQ